MKNILKILIVMICCSCNEPYSYHKHSPSFPEESTLTATKHYIENVVNPDFMTKFNDNIIIASSSSDSMLHTYLLPDIKHISSVGIKGQGPDDFSLFPMFCKTPKDTALYIWGYTGVTINKFAMNDDKRIYRTKNLNIKKYEAFNDMHILNDSLLIYYLPDELTIKKYDLVNSQDLNQKEFEKDEHNESYFYSNRGMIAANDSTIIYSYIFKHRIEIYDINTMKLKHVIEDEDDGQEIIPKNFESCKYHYRSLVAGDNYFYALYLGQKADNKTPNTEVIEVYDYAGKPIKRYSFDISPQLYIIDETNKKIYGYSFEHEDFLLSYDM